MQPLQDLLHRIQWDPEFGKGRFALGYVDRVAGTERIVPFSDVTFDRERTDFLTLPDEDGESRHIPLHRVRTVYRDGVVIWHRSGGPGH